MPAALCGAALLALVASASRASDAPVIFDSTFLHRGSADAGVDLSVFAFANRVLPGLRVVTVVLNGVTVGSRNVMFQTLQAGADATPCLTRPLLEELGFNVLAFSEIESSPPDACLDLRRILPDTLVSYDIEQNMLRISIPQAALLQQVRGAIPRSRWDDGQSAFWASYRATHQHARFKSDYDGRYTQNTTFGSLRAGLNMGPWRLRSNMSYYDSAAGHDFDLSEIYLERDLATWDSRIRVGDAVSPGSAFGATRFRGVQLKSEEAMRPDSQRGYAPTVQGVAVGNARVTVRQNGYVIYTTFVPAGPFVINDLYATPGGGDLEVEVEELGGATTRFVQPYAALPTMVREGVWDYSVLAGEYRNGRGSERPWMAQGTFAHGIFSGATLYGGWTSAKRYNAGSLGMVFNLETMGAISADFTRAHSRVRWGERQVGNALRFQYSKVLVNAGTDFRVLGYRYSSSGYRSLNEAVAERDGTSSYLYGARRAHEYQLSVSQRLNGWGNISANFYRTNYHNLSGVSKTLRFGYAFATPTASYFLSYDLERDPWQRRSTQVMFQVSIPFSNSRHIGGYALSRSTDGGVRNQASLSGALNEDYSGSYSLSASTVNNHGKHERDAYASASYLGRYGQVSASHAYTQHANQTQVEVSGALILDQKGVILGQSIGETAIIIDAPGAADVALQNNPGIRTNVDGRAFLPSAVPYRENRVSLMPGYTSDKVALTQDVKTVVPTYGAIVVASFATEEGRTVLVSLRGSQGGVIPFGAAISDVEGTQRSIVGPAGRAWLTGLLEDSRFRVQWGLSESDQCTFEIIVDEDSAPPASQRPREVVCE